jgi:hypothetical protein
MAVSTYGTDPFPRLRGLRRVKCLHRTRHQEIKEPHRPFDPIQIRDDRNPLPPWEMSYPDLEIFPHGTGIKARNSDCTPE